MILLQLVPETVTWLLPAASDQQHLLQINHNSLPCLFKLFLHLYNVMLSVYGAWYFFSWHMPHLCTSVIMLVQALCQWHSLLYQDVSQVPFRKEISLVVHCCQTVLWGLMVLEKEEDVSRCGLIGCKDMSFSLMVFYNQEITWFPVNTDRLIWHYFVCLHMRAWAHRLSVEQSDAGCLCSLTFWLWSVVELFLEERWGRRRVQCWITACTIWPYWVFSLSVSGRKAKYSRSGLLIIQGNLVFEPLLWSSISQLPSLLLSAAPELSFTKCCLCGCCEEGCQNVQSLLCVTLCQTQCREI